MRIFRIGSVSALLAAAMVAAADVKVVSNVVTTGNTQMPGRTITTYYKGDSIRIDSGDAVWLMNASTNKTTILDAKSKTYTEFALGTSPGNPATAGQVRTTGKTKVAATKDSRLIAGKSAQKYVADVSIKATVDTMPGVTEQVRVKMEMWTTSDVSITISPIQMASIYTQIFAGLGPVGNLKELTEEFAKVKGLPLSNNATMTMTLSDKGGKGRKSSKHTVTMGYITETLSVTEGDLDASLFQIPAGYTPSTKPLAPGP